ncbi:hypothetical protein TNCV_4645611 [Trichonephila clavipes]|nr:hypothetical protein TNCV_4645611 [Trichonephila clavipes]
MDSCESNMNTSPKIPQDDTKKLSVQMDIAIFEELPSDEDSAASNNRGTDNEDYEENVAQGENISLDYEEIII